MLLLWVLFSLPQKINIWLEEFLSYPLVHSMHSAVQLRIRTLTWNISLAQAICICYQSTFRKIFHAYIFCLKWITELRSNAQLLSFSSSSKLHPNNLEFTNFFSTEIYTFVSFSNDVSHFATTSGYTINTSTCPIVSDSTWVYLQFHGENREAHIRKHGIAEEWIKYSD